MNFSALLYLVYIGLLGIITTHLFPLPLSRAAKTFIGPALGIIIVTQITLVVSLLVSFHRGSIVAAASIYSVCIIVAFLMKRPLLTPPRFTLKQLLIRLKSVWPFILVFLSVGSLVVYIFWTKVLTPSDFGLVTGSGGLYGDTALHSAYTMSIVEQGLPPTNPLFAQIPLIYPFLVNLFSASLVKLGMNLRFAFILPQMLYFVGFITLFYLVAKRLNLIQGSTLRNANRASFITLLIFFLGWGLGFTEYIADVSKTDSFLPTREYTNNLPGFHLHNVLSGLIFPERSFLPGLFIGMLITSFFIPLQVRNSPSLPLILRGGNNIPSLKLREGQGELSSLSKSLVVGILLGILPLWHTHTFLFFSVAVGVWIVVFNLQLPIPSLRLREGQGELRNVHNAPFSFALALRGRIVSLVTIYATASLLALPVFLWFGQQVSHDSFIRFSLGWMDSKTNPLLFWFKNTGLLIPLALLGVVLIKRNLNTFFIPALLMFFVANFVVFQPWEWDNIKLFSWVFLFLSIAAGYGLYRISQIRLIGLIWPVVLLTLAASGTLSLIHITSQEFGIYSHDDILLAEWVKAHTPKEAVFLIDPWPTHPIPGLTGRSVYLGYPGHLWVHGIKYGKREALVRKVLAGDVGALERTEVPIDYVVADKSQKTRFIPFTPVYENQKLVVFKVR